MIIIFLIGFLLIILESAAYNENNYHFLEDNDIDNEIKKKRNSKK